jgi:nitrogen fixation protein NifU and related proteins
MSDDLTDLYQQVILDHCRKPRNFRELEAPTRTAEGQNPLCGDQLRLFLRLKDDHIEEISFIGSGCCISKASASLLTESVKGRSATEVRALFDRVHDMVTTGRSAEDMGKLTVFAGVHKFPARVKCAILPWHAVLAALAGQTTPVSTEKEDT